MHCLGGAGSYVGRPTWTRRGGWRSDGPTGGSATAASAVASAEAYAVREARGQQRRGRQCKSALARLARLEAPTAADYAADIIIYLKSCCLWYKDHCSAFQ